ncbi:MAG: ABC transporter ATP-binding protein [Propionibacteriaceae bacterium]|nr:ABC transporter ATP-binding protein [Propionibacteriaceae bacterium]
MRLTMRDLEVGYRSGRRRRRVLAGLSADLDGGVLVGLVGPNGAGKSTLLRTLVGLQEPLAGRVLLGGRDLTAMKRDEVARQVAVVLTDHIDPGRLTVAEVVGLGRHPHTGWSGRLSPADQRTVAEALQAVGGQQLSDRMMQELSDGQRQRVMIARAIAQEPGILLLDEPTAFLDPPGRIRVFELLAELAHDRGLAVIICTHDVEVAARYADQLWVVGHTEDMRTGSPQELAHSGVLEAAFGGDVAFDPVTYTFRSVRPWRPGRNQGTS